MLDIPNYKLYYFDVCGIGEPIRYLLSYCGIPFEDKRLDYDKEWIPTYKAEMPMEQVPVLEIDGKMYHQHMSICRYIAKKNNLAGADEEQAYLMDALIEDMNDLRLDVGKWFKETDPQLKDNLKEVAVKQLAFCLSKFEARVEQNDGFFVGSKVSWVDIYYAAIIEMMSKLMEEDLHKNYPNLKSLAYRVRTHMMIAPYIQSRPYTRL